VRGGNVSYRGKVAAGAVELWHGKEERTSFLKKRSKKLLQMAPDRNSGIRCWPKQIKVFWFFFAKKNNLPYFAAAAR
jgi:hypothetical protein